MRPKKFEKKLRLNKKTVVHLNHGEMENAQGGIGCTAKYTNCASCAVSGCCPTSGLCTRETGTPICDCVIC